MTTLVVGGFKENVPKRFRHIDHGSSQRVMLQGVHKVIFITSRLSHGLMWGMKKLAKKHEIKMEFLGYGEFKTKYMRGK